MILRGKTYGFELVSGLLLLLVFAHCGSSRSGQTPDAGIMSEGGLDASAPNEGGAAAVDATSTYDGPDGPPPLKCGAPCPSSEPRAGDSCDFDLCEYGGNTFFACDRTYGCLKGFVVLLNAPDASTCVAAQPAGCPSSRASIVPGATCNNPMQCVFAEGECDCLYPGQGAPAVWECAPEDAGGGGGCPVPRAPLESPCSPPEQNGGPFCQSLGECLQEACSACGTWGMFNIPCSNP